MGDTPGR
jgi:hypothetical protein